MKALRYLPLLLAAGAAHAAEVYVPGAKNDPRLRSVAYEAAAQKNLTALTELLELRGERDLGDLPPDYQWQLAQAYVNFGMGTRAQTLYRNLAETAPDNDQLAKARLQLAEFQYERGYWEEARATLYSMREKLPDSAVIRWQDLLSRVLLAEGRYSDAIEVLTGLKNADRQSEYTRYNYGVALINNGDLKNGREVIDRVGRLRPEDVETMSLRDRANLALGWHYLRAELASNARDAFYRIRSAGPYSNRALLGLGWAELAPGGKTHTRDIPDDLTPFSTFATLGGLLKPGFLNRDSSAAGPREFRLDNISPVEAAALRRALAAWVELIQRDPLDPAVQEAYLAIPYSLDRLGAHTEALQYYEKAVEHLEQNRQRLDVAMANLKKYTMVETVVRRDANTESGWQWKLKDLADTPETYYLQNLIAEHRYQEALKNYRDIRLMARVLDTWKSRLTALELAHAAQGGEDVSPEVLFVRAKEGWVEPWKHINIQLRLDTELSPPGITEAPFKSPADVPVELNLAPVPARFNGPSERIEELRARMANLRELIATAGGQEAQILQDLGTKELMGQKKQVEKYLVEARFALARLYDRQLNPEKAKAEPQPEKKEGLFNRFLHLFGGSDDTARTHESEQKKGGGK
ncbi:MAG TPA: hypothetical protein VHE37_13410 [Nevskiaceae bacterium]|nr:hypothetical protein [Nevskiaceae bacterium]